MSREVYKAGKYTVNVSADGDGWVRAKVQSESRHYVNTHGTWRAHPRGLGWLGFRWDGGTVYHSLAASFAVGMFAALPGALTNSRTVVLVGLALAALAYLPVVRWSHRRQQCDDVPTALRRAIARADDLARRDREADQAVREAELAIDSWQHVAQAEAEVEAMLTREGAA